MLESERDGTIYRYRKGFADFLDRVANKPEDALEQLSILQEQRVDKDILYSTARNKVKVGELTNAFLFLENSIDAGFTDVQVFQNDLELKKLSDDSLEGGNSEKYMECLTRIKVPLSERDSSAGTSNKSKNKKKKKGK